LREACALDRVASALLDEAVDRVGLSARGAARTLRVARTIADLAGASRVDADTLAEALQYRAYEARRFAARS
jgi:magnesium chelatase family protein